MSKGIARMQDMWDQMLEVFEKQPTDQESSEILEIEEQPTIQGSYKILENHNYIL